MRKAGLPDDLDSRKDHREDAIREFVRSHFEQDAETGILVPLCSEKAFMEKLPSILSLRKHLDEDETRFGPPLVASQDEWIMARLEFRKLLNAVPPPLRQRVLAGIALAKSTDDWLASFGDENPASLTMIAERALQRWAATGDESQLDLARAKLRDAACKGDPEAAYLLSSYHVVRNHDPKLRYQEAAPLEEDSSRRREYERRAALAGHPVVTLGLEWRHFNDNENWKEYESVYREDSAKDARESRDRITKLIGELTPLAADGDTDAQVALARLLHEKRDTYDFEESFSEATKRELKEAAAQEEMYLRSAAVDQPEARFLLVAYGFERDNQEILRLLRSAAFPAAGERPWVDALVTLATHLAQAGELGEAKQCLRRAIADGVEARLELADLLYDHSSELGREISEAIALYEAIADQSRYGGGSARAALRSGLAYLRGNGVAHDLEKARGLFEIGAKIYAYRSRLDSARDPESGELGIDPASLYCEIAWLLGWGVDQTRDEKGLHEGIRSLFNRLTSRGFEVEKGDVILTGDALILAGQAPKPLAHEEQPTQSRIPEASDSVESAVILLLLLIRLLSEPALSKDDIKQLLGSEARSESVEYLLLRGWVDASYRFGEVDLDSAEKVFHRVKSAVKDERGNRFWREDVFASTQSRQQWLIVEAERGLRHCAEVKVVREAEVAKREAIEDMMAMFAHKFRGPVDSILFNSSHRMEPRLFVDAARTMNGLLDIFSVVSTTPDKLVADLQQDQVGPNSPQSVLVHALKLALIQLLSPRNRRRLSPHYLAYAKRNGKAPADLQISAWSREDSWETLESDLQAHWEMEIGHMAAEAGFPEIAAWMDKHLLLIKMDGFEKSKIGFAEYGPKASLLTVIFTEILVNAIKHSEPRASEPILVSWEQSSDEIVFRCTNPSTRESRQREATKGSGRGHRFLAMIADHLTGRFRAELQNTPSSVSFSVPFAVLKRNEE